MDATNLATLFAPNILHTFADDSAFMGVGAPGPKAKPSGFAPAAIIGSQAAGGGPGGKAQQVRKENRTRVVLGS